MRLSSKRFSALISGIALVLMAIAAGFAYGFVYNKLVVPDNAIETTKRITENHSLYSFGLIAWLTVLALDVVVGITLLYFFRGIHVRLSYTAMILRLIYSAFLAFGIYRLAEHEIQQFQFSWSIGLVFFGMHLMVIGTLVYRSVDIPKIWGILLWIAGISYAICHLSKLIFGDLTQVKLLENTLSLPMVVGELGFAIWLLLMGMKSKDNSVNTEDPDELQR